MKLIFRHLFNQERLVVTSPEGLKEVLGQNSYDYVKPHLLRAMVGKILGYGLLLSEGDVHKVCWSSVGAKTKADTFRCKGRT